MKAMHFKQKIWYNGHLVDWANAQTHVLSHGLNISGSVFEGIRVYNGQPFYLREHVERLLKSAELLGFKIPYELDVIEDAIAHLVRIEQIDVGYVRPLAWVSTQTPSIYCNNEEVSLAIIVLPLKSPLSQEERILGLSLKTSTYIRPAFNMTLWQAKASSHYITSCRAIREAKSQGYDDALILDSRGYVTETSGANIFMIKNGILYTPIPDCFLNGITRQIVVQLARKIGISVEEKHITFEELMSAEEIFLTGTAYEIVSVRKIDGTVFRGREITKNLQVIFNELKSSRLSAAPTLSRAYI